MNFSKYLAIFDEQAADFSDEEYLEQTVRAMYRSYSNHFICGIKDTKSIYLAGSKLFTQLIGLNQRDIIGITANEFPCEVSALAELFYNQDRSVELSKVEHRYLDVHDYATGVDAYIFHKLPIINPTTGNVLGTYNIARKLKLTSPVNIISNLHQNKLLIGSSRIVSNETADLLKLTNREREVLFCIAIGLTDRKTIANFLSMIHKKNIGHDTTVKDILHSLYQKVPSINSIQALMEYAIANGYHESVPESLLLKGSFFVE